jgi:hypothetical protein
MIRYKIKITKDHSTVLARYEISAPVGGELIASFSLYINGENIITGDVANNTKLTSTKFYRLQSADKDCSVSFALSGGSGWSVDGTDVLRGGHDDEAEFSN